MTARAINWQEYHKTQAAGYRNVAENYRRTAALMVNDPHMAMFCLGRARENDRYAQQEDSMSEAAR